MRYTESRLSQLAMSMLEGIDEETIDFLDNFDGSSQEPKYYRHVPKFISKRWTGIAVGMATNIPPHNLQEISDAAIYLINNPEATTNDLMELSKDQISYRWRNTWTFWNTSGIQNRKRINKS